MEKIMDYCLYHSPFCDPLVYPSVTLPSSPSHLLPFCSTGEFLSLAAMDTFLRSVQPEVNDLFVLSLVLINLLAWMDLFITQVTSCFPIRHIKTSILVL